jgi:hypothetical protein
MRASQALFSAAATVVAFSIVPQLAEAGPCSSDIAELEITIQRSSVRALGELEQQPVNVQLRHQAKPDSAKRTDEQSQFSAIVARAKRLDIYGDRFGCFGALNAARHMYVLVARPAKPAR